MEPLRLYVVTVNGAVASVALLSAEDGAALTAYVNDRTDALSRAEVIDLDGATIDLIAAQAEVEQAFDMWEVL